MIKGMNHTFNIDINELFSSINILAYIEKRPQEGYLIVEDEDETYTIAHRTEIDKETFIKPKNVFKVEKKVFDESVFIMCSEHLEKFVKIVPEDKVFEVRTYLKLMESSVIAVPFVTISSYKDFLTFIKRAPFMEEKTVRLHLDRNREYLQLLTQQEIAKAYQTSQNTFQAIAGIIS